MKTNILTQRPRPCFRYNRFGVFPQWNRDKWRYFFFLKKKNVFNVKTNRKVDILPLVELAPQNKQLVSSTFSNTSCCVCLGCWQNNTSWVKSQFGRFELWGGYKNKQTEEKNKKNPQIIIIMLVINQQLVFGSKVTTSVWKCQCILRVSKHAEVPRGGRCIQTVKSQENQNKHMLGWSKCQWGPVRLCWFLLSRNTRCWEWRC